MEKLIKIFSPEGRIHQIEHAFKAVEVSGMTSIAVRGKDSVVVCSQRKVPDKLIVADSVTNIFRVSEGIGAVMVGNMNDARTVLAQLQNEASEFRFKFFYEIPTRVLAQRMGSILQKYSQYAYIRPLCVTVTLVGCDEEAGPQVFKVDPAGNAIGYKAIAAGAKEQEAITQLEKHFKKNGGDTDEKETIITAIKTLNSVISSDFKASDIEVGIATTQQPLFRKLEESRVEELLNEMNDML